MATPRVTHVPAQPRQSRHASTSTHGSPGKTRAHARCPNLHPRSRYLQDPASGARPRSPGPSAVSHSPLLRLRLHNLHHHDHLIHHHHHVLIQHSTPQAAGDTSQTGPQTRPHREQPRRHQGPRPDEASTHDPADAQDRRQTATQTQGSTRSRARTQAQTRRHDGRASPAPRGRPLRHPAPAVPGPKAAAPSAAAPHHHRRHGHHLHGGARRGRSAKHLVPPPLKARTPGPRTTPDQAGTTPGSTSSLPAPLPALDDSPHATHAALPPPPRIPAQPRGGDRTRTPAGPHPRAPPLPTHPHGTGLRGIPQARHRRRSPRPRHTHPRPLLRPRPQARPGTVVAALDPHAALGAAEVGPGRALPRGPSPSAPQGVGGELPPPAGGGVDAAGRMGSHAGRCAPPPRSPPPQPPQDHLYVLGRLRETLQETQRDGIRLWDITQSPAPHAHTPSPPHKRRRTDTGDTHSTPGALRATQHDAPNPPASGAAI